MRACWASGAAGHATLGRVLCGLAPGAGYGSVLAGAFACRAACRAASERAVCSGQELGAQGRSRLGCSLQAESVADRHSRGACAGPLIWAWAWRLRRLHDAVRTRSPSLCAAAHPERLRQCPAWLPAHCLPRLVCTAEQLSLHVGALAAPAAPCQQTPVRRGLSGYGVCAGVLLARGLARGSQLCITAPTRGCVVLAAAGATLALVPVVALTRAALHQHMVRTQVLFVGGQ